MRNGIDSVETKPTSYPAKISSPSREKWNQAMRQELDDLLENDRFTLTDSAPGRIAISGRRAYIWKARQDKELIPAKHCLITKWFMEEEKINYSDTYGPTSSVPSIRLSTGVVVGNDVKLSHINIQETFVQVRSKEEVQMKLPPGCYELAGNIVELNKSPYPLKQV